MNPRQKIMPFCVFAFVIHVCIPVVTFAQRYGEIRNPSVAIEYVHYRPVKYETENVIEKQNERPNRGGLVFIYLKNISNEQVRFRRWYLNRKESIAYRLSGQIAWDRLHHERLDPGQMTVLEISGLSEDFAPEKPFEFAFIGGNWRPSGGIRMTLTKDPVDMTFIRVLPGMKQVQIHLSNSGEKDFQLLSAEVIGMKTERVEWASKSLPAKGNSIANIHLSEILKPSQLLIVKVQLDAGTQRRNVYAHRRAFEDHFPIGTWGADPELYAMLRHHHIDTVVQGGRSDDYFYKEVAPKYGFHTMVHTGIYPDVDTLRDLGTHPSVSCWMIQDEPDWNKTTQMVFTAVETTHRYNNTKPSLITFCRNVKFCEYAFIVDIPCQDHYSVTAPSSSSWPKRYGTHLEETAYYTRDSKYASYPKPIWVWSQGIFNWDERPKRPVPTPDELAAQLMLNLGRGAKGILWFTFKKSVGEKYPDLRKAIQGWGRVLELLRQDWMGSEPIKADIQAPEKIDVAVVAGWDKLITIVFNQDYQIHDEAYPWKPASNLSISLKAPSWIRPVTLLEVSPEGIRANPFQSSNNRLTIPIGKLHVVRIFVFVNDSSALKILQQRFSKIIKSETRQF
jgi:hypothetical protein